VASLVSGSYTVAVSNSIGQSNPLSLNINWNPGRVSWNSGGSTAGGVVKITNGGGYPASIDGVIFAVSITSGPLTYPVNILSCCSGNSISIQMPPAPDGTSFNIIFTGPINSITHVYTTSNYLTPTAAITSSNNLTVGSNTITFAATNSYTATINSLQLVSTINSSYSITIPNNTWATTGTGGSAVTQFTASLAAGSYNLIVSSSPNGFISIPTPINVLLPTNLNTNS
jgi:hypothetical protein